jgi:hypothetical protein
MADDAKEAAKKKAFYHQQRLDAEAKAESGDREAAGTAKKISAKTGNLDKAKRFADIQQFGKTGANVAEGIDKASSLAGKAATAIDTGGIGGLAKGAAKGVAGAAKGLFPKAAEGVAKILGRYGGKAGGAAVAAAESPQAETKIAKAAESAAKGTTKKSSLAGKAAAKAVKKAPKLKTPIEKGSPLEKVRARQTGKAKFSEKPTTGRKDKYVRSKAGPENKRAAKES